MNIIPFRRIAKNFAAAKGPDSITIKPEDADQRSLQPLHYGPKQTVIDWDPLTGKALSIKQEWSELQLSNAGEPLLGQTRKIDFVVNQKDKDDFINMLGDIITGFLWNGFIRVVLGDNYKPIVGPEGLIPDSAYNTEEPAPHNYQTHDVDGTPFYPELEPEPPMEGPGTAEPNESEVQPSAE